MNADISSVTVVLASRGRPDELAEVLDHLAQQSLSPKLVIISATERDDVPESRPGSLDIDLVFGSAGSCAQRNRAMSRIPANTNVVAFFDDDFLPSKTAIENIHSFFESHDGVSGINGYLIDDGIRKGGISSGQAQAQLREYDARTKPALRLRAQAGLYGCNMVFRYSSVRGLKFDERLPLYGWQEDIDFSARRTDRGQLLATNVFAGVHRGVSKGRVSGTRFGYSQVANPIYLARKGSMSVGYAAKLILSNMTANLVKGLRPESWIDRSGRTKGNWIAIRDILTGRLDPSRAVALD